MKCVGSLNKQRSSRVALNTYLSKHEREDVIVVSVKALGRAFFLLLYSNSREWEYKLGCRQGSKESQGSFYSRHAVLKKAFFMLAWQRLLSPHYKMLLQRLFIDSLLLTFHKLFHRFAVQSLSMASRSSRLGQGGVGCPDHGRVGPESQQGFRVERRKGWRQGERDRWGSGMSRI